MAFERHFLKFLTFTSADDRRRLDQVKASLDSSSPPSVLPRDVFDRIQRRVYAELSTDLFYRFLRSEHFARYLEDKEDPDGSKRRRSKLEYFFGLELKVENSENGNAFLTFIQGPLHRTDLLPLKKRKVVSP